MKTFIVLLLNIFVVPSILYAQRITKSIVSRGIVIDSATHKPAPYVTVTLLNKGDSTIWLGLTQADGSFKLQASDAGSYTLRLQGVGYTLKNLLVELKDSGGSVGTLSISRSTQTLDAIIVAAQRPVVKQEADHLSYDLQADPQSKVSSVLEMMRKVPYLSVDGNDNVLLNGSNGYKIYINGKPSGLLERNPKDVLRSMPASTIQRIEVITNPSSKYDAEGLAGIINIVTIKKIDNGYHGSVNLNERFPVGGPGAGLSFTYKDGRFGASLTAGANKYRTPKSFGSLARHTYQPDTTQLIQNNNKTSDNRTAYAGLELSFEVDSLNLLSAQFNTNGGKNNGDTYQSAALTASPGKSYQYSFFSNNHGQGSGIDAGLNYQKSFKANKDKSLSLSYRYMTYNNTSVNNLQLFDLINYDRPGYEQYNNAGLSEHTLQFDYVQPLKSVLIEAGAKGIFRKNKSIYTYASLDTVTGKYKNIEEFSNIFNNSQNVYALYNTYTYTTKQWTVKAGVRLEQTSIRNENNQGYTSARRDYLNLVPSLVLSRKLINGARINLSYANRIQRPAVAQLNPFIDRSNPDFQTTGNPQLRPVNSNAYQISYASSGKFTFNISLGYLYFKSLINLISSYDTIRNLTLAQYQNTGKGQILKTNFFFNYQLSKKINFSFNSDLRYIKAYAVINNLLVKNSSLMAYVNASASYQLGKSWRANGDFTFSSSGLSGVQTNVNGYIASTLSVNKELVTGKLSASAAVSNPFTQYRYANESNEGPDFYQHSFNKIYYRSFALSLNYRFGKLKAEIKKTARGIKNDDLSN